MVTKVKYTDIKPQWLSAKCLNLIAKYARHASQVDDTKISVRSDYCLVEVAKHVKKTDDSTLKLIFRELQHEITDILGTERMRPKIDALNAVNTIGSYKQPSNISEYQHRR